MNLTLAALLDRINGVLRDWTTISDMGCQGDLQLSRHLCLAPGCQLASPEASACQLEVAPPSLPTWVATDGRQGSCYLQR